MTRALAITLAVIVTGPVVAGAEAADLLTIEQAVTLALAHNRTLAQAELSEQVATAAVAVARSRRLPSVSTEVQVSRLLRPVDITFPAGAFGTFSGIGAVPATDATITTEPRANVITNVTVSQPITGLIQAGLNIRMNDTARAVSRTETHSARLVVVRQVRNAYYSVAQAMSALEAVEAQGRLLAEMDRIVTARVAQRVQLRADGFDVQARQAQNAVNQLKWRHAVAAGKEQLNLLLGRDLNTEFEILSAVDGGAPSTPFDANDAVGNRPDVQRARLRAEQAALAVRVANADRLPEVGVLFQALAPRNIDGAPRQVLSAGLQVKWEPFDWGRRSRALATRRLEARQAEVARKDAEDGARLEIARATRAVDYAQALLRAADLARRTAQEQARVRLAQFTAQTALTADVLQAQASLAESTTQYEQALLAVLSARADLDHALGEELVP